MGKFGDFISERRKAAGMTLRGFASVLEIAPSYLSDIEKGNRKPDKKELLDKIAAQLKLTQEDVERLYDLAAAEQNVPTAPQDISEYIATDEMARVALRTARNYKANDEDWQKFIKELKDKRG